MEYTTLRNRLREREKQKKMKTLTLENGLVIEGEFKDGKIVNVERVELPTSPVNLLEIAPYISHESLLSKEFYSAIQHIPNEVNLDFKEIFFENLKMTKEKVRIISICHSETLKPFTLPIPKLHKISVVPDGVCAFSTVQQDIEYLNMLTPIVSDSEFIETSKNTCLVQLLTVFSQPTPPNFNLEERKLFEKSYEICSKLTSTPEEETTKGNLLNNRRFYGNPGVSFLNIGFIPYGRSTYMYKNIFSLVPIITLETILNEYVPKCSEVTLVHGGCAAHSFDGGKLKRKKTKKNKEKQRKTKK